MTAPVPATRSGRCDCCTTAYASGDLILWDSGVRGWVLVPHESAASRNRRQSTTPLRRMSSPAS
ncbi:hypothetical protein JL107_16220 [Nakamurella flavida]|uniref:Uncharacterized protein n=1 Tax=Nakamurella flavida TaxID=363630 RepID=A0A938YHX1_9ACTN|nr:hypothetical protein [Nakamurella flavida]MBM9477995.1 hypothetical protein [Nakamurella flavida]MDP9778289.1 hypothetical protein [Nakamurella flavida]